jgi:hypothetical protein
VKQIPFVGLLAVAALLLALACEGGGGGPSSSPEEYFRTLEAVVDDSAERTVEAITRFEEASGVASTDDELAEAFRDFFQALATASDLDVSDLESIDPPAGVIEAHDRLIDATKRETMVLRDFLAASADAQSVAEINEYRAEFDAAGTEASDSIGDACSALNDIADDNDIDVELSC